MSDWYKEVIEEPVRDVVKMLRDNGVNTECSCGHKMYVQCQFIPDGEIKRIYDLVCAWLYDVKKAPQNFTMDLRLIVQDGAPYWSLDITFPEEKK